MVVRYTTMAHASVAGHRRVTEGLSSRLHALGAHTPFVPIENAVCDFITHHLSPPDTYL